jgi:hypothetical protein
MKVVHTAAGSFLTGTELADSMMQYALALSIKRQSATVSVPIVDVDGNEQRAEVLIGHSHTMWTTTTSSRLSELNEPPTRDALSHSAALLKRSKVVPVTYERADVPDYDHGLDVEFWPVA